MRKKLNILLLWISILAYLFYFGLISLMKFRSFGYYDFDLAVHDLSLWNILHGSAFNSILGISFLGNHMHLILFLIAPIYLIFNHTLTLLFLQTVALGLGAIPLYNLAKYLLDENWALIISIIYLFYPALGYTNLFEFHPTVFATFFLIMALYYYRLSSFSKFIIFIILSLLCQENISLVVFMFGVMAILNQRKLKWIITPMLLGSLYFLLAMVVMTHFNNNTVQFFSLYRHLGNTPQGMILNILTNPGLIFKTLARQERFVFFLHVFLPLAFLPLLSPLTLIPSLPLLAQHFLSARYTESTIFYHYTAELIPFIFVSFIYAIKFLLKKEQLKKHLWIFKVSLLLFIIFANIILGPHFKIFPHLLSQYRKDYLNIYKDELLAKVPKEASVVATFEFLSHLSHRRKLYSLHHAYMGLYTLSDRRYELPEDVEYALIDFNDFLTFRGFYHPDNYNNLKKIFSEKEWRVLDLMETIVLLKKDTPAELWLFQKIDDLSPEIEDKIQVKVEDDIELIGYNLIGYNREGVFDIIFYWKCIGPTQKDINIFLDIVDSNSSLIMRKMHPICYRIAPTNSWKIGEIYKDRCRINIPLGFLKDKCKLKIGFFDYRTGTLCKVGATADNLGRIILMDWK